MQRFNPSRLLAHSNHENKATFQQEQKEIDLYDSSIHMNEA